MARILVLNGPNLNLLGEREPGVYGTRTLADIEQELRALADERGHTLSFFQSNSEGELVDRLHAVRDDVDGVVFNPGALTHTSYVLQDAVRACGLPVVEVHLSNIAAREDFRRISVVAPACIGQVSGFGADSYVLGVIALERHLGRRE
ncbi:MAG: type II 3-dehydroquinate dehydratase [Coriobacteriia bacterium]